MIADRFQCRALSLSLSSRSSESSWIGSHEHDNAAGASTHMSRSRIQSLNRLQPRLETIKTNRLPTLQAKAGTTPRIRGDAWMATRRRVMLRDKFTCAMCGAVRYDHEVDHLIPLEQGGSNEDENLQLLCSGPGRCHSIKTAEEAKARAGA